MSGAELGASIALRFHEIPDSTQSVIDLDAIAGLSDTLDEVSDAVIASGYAAEILRTAASGAQGFDGRASQDHDLIDLLERMAASTDDEAVDRAVEHALSAADATILTSYNQGGAVKNAHGLSIFSPESGSMPRIYSQAAWAEASRWDEMIAAAGETRE
jgi:hypothetical protein